VRLIPQSADVIQATRRGRQLEAALQRERSLRQEQPAVRCGCSPNCADPAVRWCDDCDAAFCAAHDASVHAHSLAAHRRIPISAKVATPSARMNAALAAAGAQLKAEVRAAVHRLQRATREEQAAVSMEANRVAELQRQAAELQRALELKRRRLAERLAALAELEASDARMSRVTDVEAQQEEGVVGALLRSAAVTQAAAKVPAPLAAASSSSSRETVAGATGLMATLTTSQMRDLVRFVNRLSMVSSSRWSACIAELEQ
jgi:colicin import membrane protein